MSIICAKQNQSKVVSFGIEKENAFALFVKIGWEIFKGPEILKDYINFTAEVVR